MTTVGSPDVLSRTVDGGRVPESRGTGSDGDPHQTRQARRAAVIVGSLGTVAMLARLFLGGTVGMADNFDGHRLICQLGLIRHPTPFHPFEFVATRYDPHVWYGETCGLGGMPYLTTERYLLDAAKWLTPVLGYPGAMDLRALGIVCSVLFGVALALIVAWLPLQVWARVATTAHIAVVVLDSTVALYFVSPLSEPAGILGILFTVAAMARVVGRDRIRARDLVILTAAAAWTVLAKTQMATVLAAVVPILLLRAFQPGRRRPRSRAGRWAGALIGRLPGALLAAGLVMLAVWYQGTLSPWIREMYAFHQVFVEILPHSPNPRADLRELGLPEDWVKYSGDRINGSALTWDPQYARFVATIDSGRLLEFYADHPDRLAGVADRGMVGMSSARAGYLGNYMPGHGNVAYGKDCRVCYAATVFHLAEPIRWVFFPALWIGSMLLGAWNALRPRTRASCRGLGVVLAGLSVAAICQFWAVMFSDGSNDLEKHMVFAWYTTALLPALAVAVLAAAQRPSRASAGRVPPRSDA